MKRIKKLSEGEERMAQHLTAYGIAFIREFIFAPPRRWRFDFVLAGKIAVEIEGGVWMAKSGHRSAKGVMRDMEKQNAANSLGYKVYRFTTAQVKSGEAIDGIRKAIRK